jgi:hypothetical protein
MRRDQRSRLYGPQRAFSTAPVSLCLVVSGFCLLATVQRDRDAFGRHAAGVARRGVEAQHRIIAEGREDLVQPREAEKILDRDLVEQQLPSDRARAEFDSFARRAHFDRQRAVVESQVAKSRPEIMFDRRPADADVPSRHGDVAPAALDRVRGHSEGGCECAWRSGRGRAAPNTNPESRALPNKEGGYTPNYTPMAMTDVHGGPILDGDVLASSVPRDARNEKPGRRDPRGRIVAGVSWGPRVRR